MRPSAIASLALSGVLLATWLEGGAAQGAAAECVQETNGESSMHPQCWDGGKRRGRWVIRLSGGEVREGSYVAGKKQGHWVIRFPDGGVQEGSYVAGEKQGHWVLRHADGTVEEGPVVAGVRQGGWVAHRPDGSRRAFEMDRGALVAGSVRVVPRAQGREAAVATRAERRPVQPAPATQGLGPGDALRNAAGGHVSTIRQLLAEGANPNAPDNLGRTAVHLAAGNPENMAAMLAGGGNPDVQDGNGDTPLHHAARPVNSGSVRSSVRASVLRILLDYDASPNVANNKGDTPLHIAARNANQFAAPAVGALLAGGASPNKANNRGNTPLHAAVELHSRWSPAAVGVLLGAGANPRAVNRDGLTPLLLFVRDGPNMGEQVTRLVKAGADPDRKAPSGDAPLHIAIREAGANAPEEAIDALLAGGADPCLLNARGETPYNVAPAGLDLPSSLERAGSDRACHCKLGGTVLGADGFERPCDDGLPEEQAQASMGGGDAPAETQAGEHRAREWEVGQKVQECAECPEMVVVPSGTYMMGSPSSESYRVTITRPFAVGVYEVTFGEWGACVSGGGCGGYGPDDEGWGRGRHPVFYVSWDDAQAYVEWLSRKTGHEYRLLSESEWEYAARAGTRTAYWWGDDIGRNRANCVHDHCGDSYDHIAPVGSFPANPFGLHDVHGNVWEWVEDCWNNSYDGAPSDGSAWESGNCERRVLRGGSWLSGPRFLRSASRNRITSGFRFYFVGFRVARTLD